MLGSSVLLTPTAMWVLSWTQAWPALVLLLSATLRIACAVDNLPTYPLDWSVVPDSPATTRSLQAECDCKLSNGTCTQNCCCDPDCPAVLVAEFQAAGSCLPATGTPDSITYCAPAEQFAKVRRPWGDPGSICAHIVLQVLDSFSILP